MKKQTSTQYKTNMASNAKTDGLFRKIEDNNNQWFAMDFILDHLNESQKIRIRTYINGLIKEEKTTKEKPDHGFSFPFKGRL